MKQEIYQQLNAHERYAIYLSEQFVNASEVSPISLTNGVNDITTELLKELKEFDRILVVGIQDKKEGDNDE